MKVPLIFSNGVATVASQGVNFAATVFMIAVIQRHFGTEILGVWLATTTIILVLSYSELGVGNAIISLASRRQATTRDGSGVDVALAATSLSTALGLVVFALMICLILFDVWPSILGYDPEKLQPSLGHFYLYLSAFVAAIFPITVIDRMQIAEQRGYVPKSLGVIGACISFTLILTLPGPDTTLGAFFLMRYTPHFALILLNSLRFWLSQLRRFPAISRQQLGTLMRELAVLGASFFPIGLASAVAMSTDTFVISNILGASHVPEYSVPLRIFTVPTMFVGLYTVALWPAYTAAMAKPDMPWVRTAFTRSLGLAVVVTLGFCAVAIWTTPAVIDVWLSEPLPLPPGMLLAQAVWITLTVLGAVAAPLLNAAGLERFQAKTSLWMVVLNVPFSVLFVTLMGSQGAVWGSALGTVIAMTVPSYIKVWHVLKL